MSTIWIIQKYTPVMTNEVVKVLWLSNNYKLVERCQISNKRSVKDWNLVNVGTGEICNQILISFQFVLSKLNPTRPNKLPKLNQWAPSLYNLECLQQNIISNQVILSSTDFYNITNKHTKQSCMLKKFYCKHVIGQLFPQGNKGPPNFTEPKMSETMETI